MCLADLNTFTPVLLGFNHTHQARKTKMQHLNKTFHEVVEDMVKVEQDGKAFILNPIVGPEPISGSSRMKSGTTTKIVLEILALLGTTHCNDPRCFSIPELLNLYKDVCESVYSQAHSLGSLIHMAGGSLRNNGHLYYLGCGGIGLMGVIDASECPPTFGASFDDIRGFINGGIDGLNSQPISSNLSTDEFKRDIAPKLDSVDVVIVFGSDMCQIGKSLLSKSSCKKVFVDFTSSSYKETTDNDEKEHHASNNEQNRISEFDLRIAIDCYSAARSIVLQAGSKMARRGEETSESSETRLQPLLIQLAREAAMKWTVNCTSTGAHIYIGKVYRNLMVDVKVSNVKLFHRACKIVQDICKLSEGDSKTSLLKAIYATDKLSDSQRTSCVVDHVMVASKMDKVVPTAILLGLVKCPVKQALMTLNTQPNLSQTLTDFECKPNYQK